MFDFMAQAQSAHQIHQQVFDDQRLLDEQNQQLHNHHHNFNNHNNAPSEQHVDNAAYIEGLRKKVAAAKENIAAEEAAFDKAWEARRREIADFDINDFSSFK